MTHLSRLTSSTRLLAAAAGAALLLPMTLANAAPITHHSSGKSVKIAEIREATASFHNISTAEAASYGPLHDQAGIYCIADPGMGAMGVHYVEPDLIADPAVELGHPEALVYAPASDRTLHLAAVEYIVDKTAWDATHTAPPQLFAGHPFDVTEAPNRYGLATFYSQHVWVWKHNRAGMFAMWNPGVDCGRA